jgi:penicillin-binding protein 1A
MPTHRPPSVYIVPLDPEMSWRGYAWRLTAFAGLWGASSLILGFVAMLLYFIPTLPDFAHVDDYQPKVGSKIYSADGQLIGEFAQERRVLVPAGQIPPLLFRAFMSAEDKRFMQHGGIDYFGMLQAVFDKIRHPKEKLRGASTITQQVAKSLLATHESYETATERSLSRKVREALLARHLENTLSKEQILYVYATQTFFGHKAYGVGAAAEHYFRKNVGDITLAEMATLAGLPQRPSDYSPVSRPEAAWARRRYVLRRMHEDGYIGQEAYQEAIAEKITVYPRDELYLQVAPYYTEQVRRELMDRFGERAILEDGLKVYTAINLETQQVAQGALDRGLKALDKRQGYRGPLGQVDNATARTAFITKYRTSLGLTGQTPVPLNEGVTYLGLVQGFRGRGEAAEVNVAGTVGIIPLAAMRWARAPNPVERVENHYINDCRKALTLGDIVFVTPTRKDLLATDVHASKVVGEVPDSGQLFALEQDPIAQSAIVSVDPQTGYITAQIGGYDFDESSYNRAVQACREPGSSFKPIVYSAAIDKFDYTASTQIDDKPLIYDDPTNAVRWKPNNAGERFRGRLPMRTCLKDSINTPAIRIADAVGIDDVLKNARRMGLRSPLKRELGTALGSSCTTLLELMNVYVTLNQAGRRQDLVFIRKIVDRFGQVLEDNTAANDPTLDYLGRVDRAVNEALAPPRQALDPQTAFLMTSLLKNAVESGTAVGASHMGQVVAGKTGTTNDSYDAWFMGFTKKAVTGVWIGHDKKERPLGMTEQGGKTALPVWVDFMQSALFDHTQNPPKPIIHGDFAPPPGVVRVTIDPETGLLARPGAQRRVQEWYRAGSEPKDYAPDKAVLNPSEIDVYGADAPPE